MSSWIGNSLSSLSGQITNFTREVLTEGTEEVDDHATQLKLAKAQIAELHRQNETNKFENDKLKRLNTDLHERLESSELQINAISSEYRGRLEEKEEELKSLKQQHHDLFETQSHISVSSTSPSAGLSRSHTSLGLQSSGGGAADEHDFHDVIASQHEINHLRSKVQRLEAECNHWKRQVQQQGAEAKSRDEDTSDSVADLQSQIKELRTELAREIDSHQHELMQLQEVQRQKLSTLKKKHKDDISQYEDQISELHDLLQSAEEGEALVKMQVEIKQIQQKNEKEQKDLIQQLEDTRAELAAANQKIDELRESSDKLMNDSLHADLLAARPLSSTPIAASKRGGKGNVSPSVDEQVQSLQAQLANMERQSEEFELIQSDWQMEKEALEQVLVKMRSEVRTKDDSISTLQTEKEKLQQELEEERRRSSMQVPKDSMTSEDPDQSAYLQQAKELSSTKKALEAKVDELSRISAELQDINQLSEKQQREIENLNEVIKNKDSQLKEVETEAQELMEQLSEKTKELHSTAKDSNEVQSLLKEIQNLRSEIDNHDSEITDVSALMQDKEQQIEQLKVELAAQQAAIQNAKDEHSSMAGQLEQVCELNTSLTAELESQQKSRAALETELKEVQDEKESLIKGMEELDAQNQEAVNQIIQVRDNLLQNNEELKHRVTDLEEQISNLSLNNSKDEPDYESQDFAQQDTQKDVAELKSKNEFLQKNHDKLNKELKEMKQKLEEGALAFNELHMDKQDLEEHNKALENKIRDQTAHIKKLREEKTRSEEECNKLLSQLQEMKIESEKLQRTEEEGQSKVDDGSEFLESHMHKISKMEEQIASLQSDLDASVDERQKLVKKLTDLNESQQLQEEERKSQLACQTRIDALENERKSLERELATTEGKLHDQTVHYEKYIKELARTKEMDADSLQAEHKKLMKELHEKDKTIQNLQDECGQLQKNISDTKEMLETTMQDQQQISALVAGKDAELSKLSSEKSSLEDVCEETRLKVKSLEAECNRLSGIETQYKSVVEENKKLKLEDDALRSKLKDMESQETVEKVESRTLDIITELESEITGLNETIKTKDELVEEQKNTILKLEKTLSHSNDQISELNVKYSGKCESLKKAQDTIETQEVVIRELEKNISTKEENFESLKGQLLEQELHLERQKEELLNQQNLQQDHKDEEESPEKHMVNGDLDVMSSKSSTHIPELNEMRKMISQKDEIITELTGNNSSLLKMLEERSNSAYGNNIMVDYHKLENESKSLRREKEQILTVLNEKSRECSSLRSENHRLMNVTSAQQAAINKLQQDNQELLKQKPSEMDEEMTKETIQKLSQIIRDKDMEIEALTQKNASLLQVLQEGSGGQDGGQMASLVKERQSLVSQLEAFQKDRQQIMLLLQQKHQESVAYHGEIQRLTKLFSAETNKHEKLQQDYNNLVKQFEDKQQNMLKMQNELINYKQKFADLEDRHRDLLLQHEELLKTPPLPAADSLLPNAAAVTVTETDESPAESVLPPSVQQDAATEPKPPANFEPNVEHSSSVQASSGSPVQEGLSQQQYDILQIKCSELTHECDRLKTQVSDLNQKVDKLNRELSELNKELSDKERTMNDLSTTVLDKNQLVSELNTAIADKDRHITEKDKIISDLNTRVHRLEENVSKKDIEVNTMRKQHDSMMFELQGFRTESRDLKKDNEQFASQLTMRNSEVGMLKESTTRLSSLVSEKEFENQSMKEKINTLTKLVHEQGSDSQAEVERLMQETEAMQHQAQLFQQERDQALFTLQQKQAEVFQIQQELQKAASRQNKQAQEVERLRSHLLQIEEAHTCEALEAEEREKDLRNRLAVAEEKVLSQSSAVETASVQATQQVVHLQQQLHILAEQRDSAVLQLASAQETANQYATSLANLQMVLEQFQQERDSQQMLELEKYDRDLKATRAERDQLMKNIHELQGQLHDQNDALEAAQRLSEQLDSKQEIIAALREEVQIKEAEKRHAEQKIEELSNIADGKVDKLLVKNMILGYFHTPSAKKPEAMALVGKVLNFTPDEMKEVAQQSSNSWLAIPSFIKRSSTSPPTTPKRAHPGLDKSFSELFREFLEKESSPKPQMKLPAEAMAREQQQKYDQQHKQKQQKPAFNPFAAPVNATLPIQIGGQSSSSDSHILMKPMSGLSAPGLFAPVVTGSHTGVSTGASAGPVASSSGRSTPSSSSAVLLKDVLQQT